ncbi:glycine-rich RNA-binding protein 10-like [Beta vulgaris subsp. vulgaris]|uniref:glycine-rich RNA-binding protein 10-like n=1 Tax=Beta vulgaris subsp. vulgaris TaxID=3555 RepID=UPI00203698B4|nr:glycine-rich RNA-binding protein 10-like [Beta vulgaris subsp. vulgaris]
MQHFSSSLTPSWQLESNLLQGNDKVQHHQDLVVAAKKKEKNNGSGGGINKRLEVHHQPDLEKGSVVQTKIVGCGSGGRIRRFTDKPDGEAFGCFDAGGSEYSGRLADCGGGFSGGGGGGGSGGDVQRRHGGGGIFYWVERRGAGRDDEEGSLGCGSGGGPGYFAGVNSGSGPTS